MRQNRNVPLLRGLHTTLRPATIDDRSDIYAWLARSDLTSSVLGPPHFPDAPIPSWSDFCSDYAPHFFDGSRPERARSFIIQVEGKAVGHINYDGLDSRSGIAELDIWMRCLACCGQGWGTDALITLSRDLARNHAARRCVIRPSARNRRAVRAYRKAGFRPSEMSAEQIERAYGPGDYVDTVTLEWNQSSAPDPPTQS